jgi:ketosteroid isomerase-like protein
MPTKKSTVEATLKDIEDKWEASFMSHDPSVAQAYLGDDYRGVSSKGKVMSKSSLLAEIKKDTDTYTSAKNGNMDVRVYGGHFAVVMGTSTEAGKDKDGKAFKRSFRWTDAWVDRNGKWQCVASQSMLLSK